MSYWPLGGKGGKDGKDGKVVAGRSDADPGRELVTFPSFPSFPPHLAESVFLCYHVNSFTNLLSR